jgi:hypothetical protein
MLTSYIMATASSVCRFAVGVTAFAGLAAALPSSPVLVAAPAALVLNVRLTATQDLPPLARLALMNETQSIWDDGHVRLRWVRKDADANGAPLLPVILRSGLVPPTGDAAPLTVAELVRYEALPAVALASITGARRVIASRRFLMLDPPATRDRRLGVVLGRAVAHEIGHYLLQTDTHAVDGLMRARIQAEEFADLQRRTFRLDKAALAHLAALAAAGTFPPDRSAFSYEPN